MALSIRLSRGGSKKRPYYRVVVADSRSPRDGKYLEKIGTYNPLLAKDSPERVQLDADRARHWLGKVGLARFADAYPHTLSGGMKARVAIARALAMQPAILLMDEPFAALDEITRFRLNNDLLAVWRNLHKTVIFVTHSVFESVYLSQRVLVMSARPGRIAAEFSIDAPERGEEFRTSAEYAGFCRKVSAALAPAFAAITREWVEHLFTLEDNDRRIIDDPHGTIVARGGFILFVEADGLGIVGTCALIRIEDGVFELTGSLPGPVRFTIEGTGTTQWLTF